MTTAQLESVVSKTANSFGGPTRWWRGELSMDEKLLLGVVLTTDEGESDDEDYDIPTPSEWRLIAQSRKPAPEWYEGDEECPFVPLGE